jgi:hypothetical protein
MMFNSWTRSRSPRFIDNIEASVSGMWKTCKKINSRTVERDKVMELTTASLVGADLDGSVSDDNLFRIQDRACHVPFIIPYE